MNIFETVREQVALDLVVSANGSAKVSCVAPHHQDNHASMHVYKDHVHCYGCGFHGDIVDVWSAQTGIICPIEAAFDLAREFNVQLPEMSKDTRQKAEEKRQKQTDARKLAQACHRALNQHDAMREWWEGRGFDEDLRARFLLGANKDGTEAVIPFWHRGRVLFLVRRRLQGEPKYILPPTEELPDGRKPLFIPSPPGRGVYLVEGYIDALAVTAIGRSAVAVGGTGISEEQIKELRGILSNHSSLYCLADDDASGVEAARTWGREFFPEAKVCETSYGTDSKDIADVFARDGVEKTAEHLDRLAAGANDMIDIEMVEASKIEGGPREKLAYATENLVPLLARITPEAMRDATADIVVDQVKGLKKSWLTKAIKAEQERLEAESMAALMKAAVERAEQRAEEHRQKVADAQQEIDALVAKDGVLGRLRDTAARMHNVYGDEEPLELALLVALGAQLEPLPNGRPLGASILLTAEAGRGKNHIVDAAVQPLPEEFYFAFEIASGQSLYYKADEDPEFLKHKFAYPNEIEGAEALWEFLRPMLSKGWAKKIVTAKDAAGNMTTRTIIVEGPVTIAIPTIRNKTDEQLQTRLLVAELPDYPGRVRHHSAAVSEQLLPDAAATDFSHEKWLWQEGLRQLTTRRRVVFPLRHPKFALDDDQVSHGARLWANLLSLMVTHAWLEQRNRRLLELLSGEEAIEATPDDYAAAYRIFNKVCKRTVINLSDTHRKILNAVWDLRQEERHREGYTHREISRKAEVALGTVSGNRAFLVTSAKLLKETESGQLTLVEGAEPSWWQSGDMMQGLPTPAQVRAWWDDRDPPPETPDHADHADQDLENGSKPHTYGKSADHSEHAHDGDQEVITEEVISTNGIPTQNMCDDEEVINAITSINGSADQEESDPLTPNSEVRRLLAAPPAWLATLLDRCREVPGRYLDSTSNSIATAIYGSTAGWREVKSILEAYLVETQEERVRGLRKEQESSGAARP